MIDWTKPLKPKAWANDHKAELLKKLNCVGDCTHLVLFTSLESGLEDVHFLDEKGRNCFGAEILESNLEPVKPHKHADVIKAWADGYKIACYLDDNLWEDCSLYVPSFYENTPYAVIDGQGYEGPAKVIKL